jgi:uncharacterized protein (DUF4415 family)
MASSKQVNIVKVGDALYESLPDGVLKPLKGNSDWSRVDAMTEEQVEAAALSDKDGLPLTDEEWAKVKLVDPFKTPVTIRLDADVVEWFKAQGQRGYQTRMNSVLRRYMEANRKAG